MTDSTSDEDSNDNPMNTSSEASDIEDGTCSFLYHRIYTSLLQFKPFFPEFTYGERYEDAFNFSVKPTLIEKYKKKLFEALTKIGCTSPEDIGNIYIAWIETIQEMAEKDKFTR